MPPGLAAHAGAIAPGHSRDGLARATRAPPCAERVDDRTTRGELAAVSWPLSCATVWNYPPRRGVRAWDPSAKCRNPCACSLYSASRKRNHALQGVLRACDAVGAIGAIAGGLLAVRQSAKQQAERVQRPKPTAILPFATRATLALSSVRSHAHRDQHARSVRSSSQSISSSATVRLCG
jgi:hypothetical protein